MKISQFNVRAVLLRLTAILVAFFIILTSAAPAFAQMADTSDSNSDSVQVPLVSAEPTPSSPVSTDDSELASPVTDKADSKITTKPPIGPHPNVVMSGSPATFKDQLGLGSLGNSKNLLPGIDPNSGASTYKYHIEVPPGRTGLQPDINLNYNSQDTDQSSIFGLGWSTDVPYITRINKTGSNLLYSTTNFSSSLDGELVSLGSGNYSAKVENGNFNKYSLVSNVWTVTDKNGTQFKFGTNTTERQIDPNNSSDVYRWMLQEVRDKNDNYIRYEYYKDAGQIYPDKIYYTGNGSTDGIFEVDFLRQSRTDKIKNAQPAFLVTSNYIVYEIDVKVSGTWMRKYALTYTTGTQSAQSILDTITETGKDDSGGTISLPAFNFDYQNPLPSGNGWAYNSSWSVPVDLSYGVLIGDVNGDGLNDLVQSFWQGSYPASIQQTYLNTGTGWTTTSNFVPPSGIFFSDNSYFRDQAIKLIDVNGDGLADLVQNKPGYRATYINTGTGWSVDSTWIAPSSMQFLETHNYDTGVRLVDINGDNLPDFIQAVGSPGSIYTDAWINNGAGWTHDTTWSGPVDLSLGTVFADVNGDGLNDIIQSYSPGGGGSPSTGTYINNGYGWTQDTNYSPPEIFVGDNTSVPDQGTRVADVNGDGLADMVRFRSAATGYLNNGAGWGSDTSPWHPLQQFAYTNNTSDTGTRLVDVNGDGMPDIASVNAVDINQAVKANLMVTITYPQSGSTSLTYQATPLYTSGGTTLNPNLPLVIDTVNQMVTSDGFGGTNSSATYSYQGGSYYYNSGSPFDHKFAGFNKIVTTDAASNTITKYYHQGNSSDSTHGEYNDDMYKIAKPYRTEIADGSGNIYQKTINKWDEYSLGSGSYFVKLAQTVDSTYDGDSSHNDKAEAYTYSNSNGNLTQKIEYGQVTGANDGTFSDTGTDDFTTAYTYATDGSYVVGLPDDVTVTDHGSTKVKEDKYYYDAQSLGAATKGNQTKHEMWKVSSTYVNTQKTYDSTYGTVASDTDQRGKTTTYSNDTYNLYPATVTNPLSQATSYTYDYTSGKVKQTTDPNTRVYQNIYDGLDRVVEVKQPDLASPGSLVTKTTYTYVDTSGSVRILKSDYLDGSTVADTYTYFDGLGRKIQDRKEAETNYSVKDYVYNNLGLLQKESFPYNNSGSSKTSATGTTSLYTSYTYDPMMRVVTTVNNLGTTTNTYNDWKLTVTDANSKTKDLYKDAYGNLVQVDEHNSGSTYSTYYTYNYLGNLLNITDALSNIRNFTYDGLGRRLTAQDLHDPADTTYFGTWTYTYDDAGNLTQTVDPNGNTINYTYDDINRQLLEKLGSTTKVTYTYDSGTDGIGHLTGITTGTLTQTNTYNANNGLASEAKVINSTNYTTTYTYDRQGDQLIITNPDSSQVKYIYNAAGLLDEVQRKESGGSFTDVVSNFDYSPTEQPTTISYANGATTTNTYDSTKLYRLSAKVTTIAAAAHAQDLAYTYDAVGNITQIIDASATSTSKTANYTYDDLYRLTQAAITSVAGGQSTYTENYTYNAIGDIASKTGVGNYTYAGNTSTLYANPHAVTSTSTGSVAYTYDNNGNELTKGSSLTNTWDYNNRITQSVAGGTTVTYDYDPSGQRIKYANGTTTTYYPSKFYNTDGTTAKKHIFALGMEIGVVNGTGGGATVRYTHTDQLTGSNIITNASDTADETLDYYPFGSIRIDSGSYGDQRKFAGQEYDADTALEYMNARYYDPAIGRFASEDPSFLTATSDLTNPQDWNSYSYVRNNPLTNIDPDGRMSWSIVNNFLSGFNNAYYTNYTLGIGRNQNGSGAYSIGQNFGDGVSFAQGLLETAGGVILGSGGVVVSGTGAGAVVGVPAAAGGAVLAGHGASLVGTSVYNFAESLKGSNNPKVRDAINYGKEQHAQYNPGEGYDLNKQIPGTNLRPDALNRDTQTVRELKPDSSSGIQKGITQLQKYVDAATKAFGQQFKGILDTYKSPKK